MSVELTYGLERITAFLQRSPDVFHLAWNDAVSYGDLRLVEEQQHSAYSFDFADTGVCRRLFDLNEQEAHRLLESYPQEAPLEIRQRFPVLPAYELSLKCSHLFNILDARGAASTTERAALIGRIRNLACRAAAIYLDQKCSLEAAR